MQVFHDPSDVCQPRLVIDNLASVISGAGGNTYIRQMNICGQINLLPLLWRKHTKSCGLLSSSHLNWDLSIHITIHIIFIQNLKHLYSRFFVCSIVNWLWYSLLKRSKEEINLVFAQDVRSPHYITLHYHIRPGLLETRRTIQAKTFSLKFRRINNSQYLVSVCFYAVIVIFSQLNTEHRLGRHEQTDPTLPHPVWHISFQI